MRQAAGSLQKPVIKAASCMWFQRRWTDNNYEFIPWEARLYEVFTKPFHTFALN